MPQSAAGDLENGTLLEKFDFSDPIPARLPSYTEAPGE